MSLQKEITKLKNAIKRQEQQINNDIGKAVLEQLERKTDEVMQLKLQLKEYDVRLAEKNRIIRDAALQKSCPCAIL